jgi:UDP-2,4-diacetamido-2,4,6-trideoxy-beta-L-altropyranose hydrolase
MNLLIRADASVAIGTGHVMRCLALAQAWQDAGGRATFAMAESTAAIEARLAAECCEVLSVAAAAGSAEDAQQTISLARQWEADWIVIDGYRFSAEYQRVLKNAGFRVLAVDDYGHAESYCADLVLNQNVSAHEALYVQRAPATKLLLGAKYALLRREFAAWRACRREIADKGQHVLVMMGGSDPENLTARVMEAIAKTGIEDLEAAVVVGGSNPHFEKLAEFAGKTGGKVRVLKNVGNVAELMAAADAAISAAGSTCWELCLLGLPALLIDVAENQTAVAKELDRRGCAIHVGGREVSAERIAEQLRNLLESQTMRRSLWERCRQLVDGKGARRVVSVLRGEGDLCLRRAQPEDCRLLWEWANEPGVRSASFSQEAISWETHAAWFSEKMANREGSVILIAEDAGTPAGQIRFDQRPDGDWEVDVSVAASMRGRGLGAEIIASGLRELRKEHPRAQVHAAIKPENAASRKAFEEAGFERAGLGESRGDAAMHFLSKAELPA